MTSHGQVLVGEPGTRHLDPGAPVSNPGLFSLNYIALMSISIIECCPLWATVFVKYVISNPSNLAKSIPHLKT